jgi:alcohol dehydrogenase
MRGYRHHVGPLGHEFIGEVVEVAPSYEAWLGKRVVGELNYGCQGPLCAEFSEKFCPNRFVLGIAALNCPHANGDPVHGGAFADLLSLPIRNLHVVPDAVNDRAAIFCEPLAAAIRILEQIHLKPPDDVVILGDGPFAFLIAQVMRWPGCAVTIAGKHPEKLSLFAELGFPVELSVESRRLFDVVVECTGSTLGLEWALDHVRPEGTIVMKSSIGARASLDLSKAIVDEIRLIGSRSGGFAPALRALCDRRIEVEQFVSETFSLEEGVRALERAGASGVRKVEILIADED